MNNERKLIANELLPIYQTTDTGEKVVDGRELHDFLQAGRDFTNWIKDRIQKYGFIEGEDFSPFLAKTPEGTGRPRTDYILKLDMAKELAMVENNEQGRQARKYFIEVERRFQNGGTAPTTPVHDYPPFPEHDQVTKLLQMLRLGIREHLFTDSTERALRTQVAEMVLGHGILDATPAVPEKPRLIERFEYTPTVDRSGEKWYTTKQIAEMAGVSMNLIAKLAKEHGIKNSVFSRDRKQSPERDTGLVRVEYNEVGKGHLIRFAQERIADGYSIERRRRRK